MPNTLIGLIYASSYFFTALSCVLGAKYLDKNDKHKSKVKNIKNFIKNQKKAYSHNFLKRYNPSGDKEEVSKSQSKNNEVNQYFLRNEEKSIIDNSIHDFNPDDLSLKVLNDRVIVSLDYNGETIINEYRFNVKKNKVDYNILRFNGMRKISGIVHLIEEEILKDQGLEKNRTRFKRTDA